MYKCDVCGKVFEEDEIYTWEEEHGEAWEGSPCCHADYEEVKECECGEIIDIYEEKCKVCKNEIKKRFSSLLSKNFNEKEIDILNVLFDGKEIR